MGKVITSFREYTRMKITELAKRTKMGTSHISLIENGHQKVSAESLERLAKGLRITSRDILVELFKSIPENENKRIDEKKLDRIAERARKLYEASP